MPCYLVCYEPSAAPKVRKHLLAGYPAQCRVTDTVWAIVTDQKPKEIVDSFASVLAPQDRLFVIRTGGEGAWVNPFGPTFTEWLRTNL